MGKVADASFEQLDAGLQLGNAPIFGCLHLEGLLGERIAPVAPAFLFLCIGEGHTNLAGYVIAIRSHDYVTESSDGGELMRQIPKARNNRCAAVSRASGGRRKREPPDEEDTGGPFPE